MSESPLIFQRVWRSPGYMPQDFNYRDPLVPFYQLPLDATKLAINLGIALPIGGIVRNHIMAASERCTCQAQQRRAGIPRITLAEDLPSEDKYGAKQVA